MSQFQSLPGFREFYPEAKAVQNHVYDIWRGVSRRFGFQEWDAPVLEPLELFTEKSGPEIVSQLFNFTDKGGREVTLRPEMTPSLARLIAAKANGMRRPIKWFAIGDNFRYEKQQKGRLRSFVQFNADILGEAGPSADAEIIALCVESLRNFGLKEGEFCIRLSDRNLWFLFLESLGVPAEKVPGVLSVVDKLERDPAEVLLKNTTEALAGTACEPAAILLAVRGFVACDTYEKVCAFLADEVARSATVNAGAAPGAVATRLREWQELLAILESMGLGSFIRVDMTIVRGLAYYTGFVFEAFQLVGRGRALAGGGRYDALVKKLGGPDMPAVGFGMGDVVLCDLLSELKLLPVYNDGPDYYAIIMGDENRPEALKDIGVLRRAGLRVEYAFRDGKFGKLITMAEQANARFALVYGSDELKAGIVKVRDMKTRKELTVPRGYLVEAMRDILENGLPDENAPGGCGTGCGCVKP